MSMWKLYRSMGTYGFIRIFTEFVHQLRTKVKNTDAKSAPDGVASITANGGLERCTEKSRKIQRLCSLPTVCCKVDLEVLQCRLL